MKNIKARMIVSLLLAVLIACSLTVCAAAEANSIKVVVKAGQNLSGICAQNGIDYGKNKEKIMRLNNFSDPRQLEKILAGSTILIPAPSNGISDTSKSSGPVSIVAGNASMLGAGDRIAYYIVLYTVRSGDSLINLYSQWEMNYNKYESMIKALNGMSDLNKLVVGKMMFLPVTRSDVDGVINYTVIEHTVASGEYAGKIFSSFGLDYNSAAASMSFFNPGVNFERINAGQKLYIPVVYNTAPAVQAQSPSQYYEYLAANVPTAAEVPAEPGTIPAVTPASGSLPIEALYNGFAVVKECNGYLSLVLENPQIDVNVAFTQQTIGNYSPMPGDYVRIVFTPTDFLLVSIQYVYNVFTGA